MQKTTVNFLRYRVGNDMKRVDKPTQEQLMQALQAIPPGAVFVVQGDQLISRLIGFWGFILNIFRAIRMGFRVWASHSGNYWGSGEHKTVEAFADGVKEGNFLVYLDEHHKVKVWYNSRLTVEKMQLAKQWDYMQIGKKYDYQAFANFVLRGIGQDKDKFICSEKVAQKIKEVMQLPFLNMAPAGVHPIDIVEYLDQLKDDWKECFSWNWDKD